MICLENITKRIKKNQVLNGISYTFEMEKYMVYMR